MKYKIVGDSSCDVTKQMEKELNIAIAPLTFTLDGEEFVDDENLDLDLYLEKIAESPNTPKSACPSIHEYLEHFKGDYDCVFGITISSELSGSYNSAMSARDMFMEKNPDKKVHIFDSRGASSMEVLIVLKIEELVKKDKNFEEIVSEVEAYIDDCKLFFVLDKIDTLEKNGRMSKMKAKIVRALNLKLVLKSNQKGVIDMVTKARGNNKALEKMVIEMSKTGTISPDKTVVISHCLAPERAEYVKMLIEKKYKFKEIMIVKMRGLSSTYSNDGGIILAY